MICGGGYGYGRSLGGKGYGYAVTAAVSRGGWGRDLTAWKPGRRKTVAEFKKEFVHLNAIEIDKKQLDVQAEIKFARNEIEIKRDLGLQSLIDNLKAFIAIEKIKLAALQQIEQERKKRKQIDADLAFIAAYMMSEDDDE